MYSDDASEPGGRENQEERQSDDTLRGAVLYSARPTKCVMKSRFNTIYHKYYPTNTAEEDIKGGEPGSIIDQCNAEGKEDPANDIISNRRCEKVQLRENSAEYRERGDLRHINTSSMLGRRDG
jgi:hypothetical protein